MHCQRCCEIKVMGDFQCLDRLIVEFQHIIDFRSHLIVYEHCDKSILDRCEPFLCRFLLKEAVVKHVHHQSFFVILGNQRPSCFHIPHQESKQFLVIQME